MTITPRSISNVGSSRRPNTSIRGTLADWKSDAAPDLGDNTPRTQSATEAAELVLTHAGASRRRDTVDRRIIDDVRNRRGKLIDSPSQVGGWPVLRSTPAPTDRDRDGMPDTWETAHGMNLNDSTDRNADRDNDGYTNLEEYLNNLCAP